MSIPKLWPRGNDGVSAEADQELVGPQGDEVSVRQHVVAVDQDIRHSAPENVAVHP